MSEESFTRSLCVMCGPDVSVDEDGCCATCGASCLGEYAETLLSERDALKARVAELEEALRSLLDSLVGTMGQKMAIEAARAALAPKAGGGT